MNDARISQFNAASALSGEEYIPIAQLSDVTNTIRTVYTNPDAFKQFVLDSISNVFCPVGSIGTYACKVSATDVPNGWLLCNGQSVSRTTYKKLFERIGTSYGCDSGSTFKLPNLKGRVVLGYCSSSPSISLSGVKGGAWNPSSKISLGSVGGIYNYTLKSAEIPLKTSTALLNQPLVVTPVAPVASTAPSAPVDPTAPVAPVAPVPPVAPVALVAPIPATSQSIYSVSHIEGGITLSINSLINGGLRALHGGNIPPQITLTYSYRQTCGAVTNGGVWQSLMCSGNNTWASGSVNVAPDANGDVLFKITDEGWGYQSLNLTIYVPGVPGSPGSPGTIGTIGLPGSTGSPGSIGYTVATTLSIAQIPNSTAASLFSVTQPYVVMNYIIKY